jgi:hypothetical protein
MPANRYSHLRDDEFQRLAKKAARLCDVATRPASIDYYAREKLQDARDCIDAALKRLEVSDDA